MIKTFITAVSLQSRNGLLKVEYEPKDFCLNWNKPTSFPIIPVIASNKEDGEKVQVIVIRPVSKNASDNFEKLMEELKALGVTGEMVKELPVEGNKGKKESIRLLLKLLDEIPEDSLIYADITFNTKPMSAMVLYAMNFVEKMKDTEVDGIYYGEIVWEEKSPDSLPPAYLYDLTSFKYLSDAAEQLSDLGITDLRKALETLVEM